jgi:hypothetical protein
VCLPREWEGICCRAVCVWFFSLNRSTKIKSVHFWNYIHLNARERERERERERMCVSDWKKSGWRRPTFKHYIVDYLWETWMVEKKQLCFANCRNVFASADDFTSSLIPSIHNWLYFYNEALPCTHMCLYCVLNGRCSLPRFDDSTVANTRPTFVGPLSVMSSESHLKKRQNLFSTPNLEFGRHCVKPKRFDHT